MAALPTGRKGGHLVLLLRREALLQRITPSGHGACGARDKDVERTCCGAVCVGNGISEIADTGETKQRGVSIHAPELVSRAERLHNDGRRTNG